MDLGPSEGMLCLHQAFFVCMGLPSLWFFVVVVVVVCCRRTLSVRACITDQLKRSYVVCVSCGRVGPSLMVGEAGVALLVFHLKEPACC